MTFSLNFPLTLDIALFIDMRCSPDSYAVQTLVLTVGVKYLMLTARCKVPGIS
jgi:hypothetical protein